MKKIISFILCTVLGFTFCFNVSAVKITKTEYDVLSCKNAELKGDITCVAQISDNEVTTKPTVNAKAVCLMEKSTGEILYSENADEKLYPASVTKIMTLLLVCEALETGKITLQDNVQTSENASSKGGSQIWLEPGETMSVDDLLKAAAVYSANDACTALGEYIAGSEEAFVSLMNNRAKELGMENTHFDNCTGLDDDTETHLTTAHDIAIMSGKLINFDIIKNYSTIWMDNLRNGETEIVNTNRLVRYYSGCTGLKTGTTSKAGCCVSATAERNGMELIAVVLGASNSNDRFNSARNMLDWGFANYETVTPEIDKSLITQIKVINGKEEYITPVMPEINSVLIRKGQGDNIKCEVEIVSEVTAPVEINQTLGTVKVKFGDKTIGEYKILCEKQIEKVNFLDVMKKIFSVLGKK